MNKFRLYKPDFDTEEGRKEFYHRVWGMLKWSCWLFFWLTFLLFVVLALVVSNRQEIESASAEVDTLSTNTDYVFSSLISNQSWNTSGNIDNSYVGSFSFDDTTYTFNCASYAFDSDDFYYYFYFQNFDGSYHTVFSLWFSIFDNTFVRFKINNGSYNFNSTNLINTISFNFSSFGSISYINNFLLANFSAASIDLTPEISFVPVASTNLYVSDFYNSVSDSFQSHYYESFIYLTRLDNTSSFLSYLTNDNTIVMSLDFLRYSGGVEVLYFTQDCVFHLSSDGYAYSLIILDPKYISDYQFSGVILYCDDFHNGHLNISDLSPFTSNYALVSLYRQNGELVSYEVGYSAGLEADKTLLSVMWQTFNLPFRLLFGTYDDLLGSPTYGQYVGGLFNFTILGVDIRAFCIGIMSFAIVLAVVRFVLGAKR